MYKSRFALFYILIDYIVLIAYMFCGFSLLSYARIALSAFAFFVLLLHQSKHHRSTTMPNISFCYILIVLLLMLINIVFVSNYTIFYILAVMSNLVVAFYLLSFKIPKSVCYIIFYLYVVVIFAAVAGFLNVGTVSWNIFKKASRNYVSFFLIYALFPLVIYKCRESCRIPIIPIIIIFVISIMAVGRGGIIMSGFLLISMIFANTNPAWSSNKKKISFALKVVLLSLMLLIMFRPDILAIIAPRFFKTGSFELNDSGRIAIWTNYLVQAQNFSGFVFGSNSLNATSADIAGNLHNSFLQLHSNTGIFGLGAFMITIVYSLIYLFKNKKFNFLAFIICILIKGFTDLTFGFYYGDVIITYIILYPFYDKKIVILKQKKENGNYLRFTQNCTTN